MTQKKDARMGIRVSEKEKKQITYLAEYSEMTISKIMVTSTINPLQLPVVKNEISMRIKNMLDYMHGYIMRNNKLSNECKKEIEGEMTKIYDIFTR